MGQEGSQMLLLPCFFTVVSNVLSWQLTKFVDCAYLAEAEAESYNRVPA